MTIGKRFAKALAFVLPVLLGGCSNLVVLHPKGLIGTQERTLIITAAAVMLIVVIPVIVLTLVFARRYRASNTKATFAPEWSHSRVIETVIWIVPVLIIITLGALSWVSTHRLDPYRPLSSSVKALTIETISLDWKWLFIYPEQHVASVNEVAIPEGVPVNFLITSDTVMNSFFIPQLGSQIYSMPGMETQLHLISAVPGTYHGLSANFSGHGFSGMTFNALVTTSEQFNDWIAKAGQSQETLDAGAYRELAAPSEYVPVRYYSSIEPTLFQEVIAKYAANSGQGQMQMGGATSDRMKSQAAGSSGS